MGVSRKVILLSFSPSVGFLKSERGEVGKGRGRGENSEKVCACERKKGE